VAVRLPRRGDTVAPRRDRDRLAGHEALFRDAQLRVFRQIAATRNAGDHLDARSIPDGHEHAPKHRLGPSMFMPGCAGRFGAAVAPGTLRSRSRGD
jgi:hypothetical protein